MKKNNLYVDIHVLQNVPPSCVNRDDAGSPKTAKYGGTVRSRVSSQAWKHEIREMFGEIFGKDEIGVRTRKVPQMIADEIKKIDNSIDDEKALKLATKALGNIGVKPDKDDKVPVLMFFSLAQARALAKLAVEECNDKKEYQAALKESPSIDMALFGRMVAADAGLNVDAAVQVAHAISTHTVHNEYDYFTAVDDLITEDESGAGHLGTVEFNSSTLYRYATVNARELYKKLGECTADAVKGFVEAFIKSMPTGKQNTFANRTVPDYIYITLRTDQPINLCSAFEKPVSGKDGGYLEMSEKALKEYSEKVYRNYACEPEKSWTFEDGNFTQILLELDATVKKMLAESGDE